MKYTVKNGTWCKDNNGQEYYSCTQVGLKAALAAGELHANDKVVVHDRQFPVGTVIHSIAANPPEGFMAMVGQTIPTIYEELIEALGTDQMPDTRECVLVGAGQNTTAAIEAHDVYAVGEFKDDQAQTHKHSRGTMEIEGSISIQGMTHLGYVWPIVTGASGAFRTEIQSRDCADTETGTRAESIPQVKFRASDNWTGQSSEPEGDEIRIGNVTRTKQLGMNCYIAF